MASVNLTRLASFLFLIFTFGLTSVHAASPTQDERQIADILAKKEAPAGVVFEVAVSSEAGLQWAIPRIQKYVKELRKKFPSIEVAVVSHGREQFSLVKNKAKQYKKVHSKVQKLVKDDNVPVHICATHASWRDVAPEDYPNYITVSATGPAAVRDYQELGYILVKVRKY